MPAPLRACFAILVVLLPVTAAAQASITGVVRDPSGAVLPGVTVEAASPELIEKVRTAVTDNTGQYRIENLRPGIYAVSFALPGFSTVRREGIELTGSFTATANAELRLGSLEETITVTGESPTVDVQSSRRQQTMDADVLRAVPRAPGYHSLMALVPGITTSGTGDVGGLGGPLVKTFSIHGGRLSEGRLLFDGISTGAGVGGSGTSGYIADITNSQEVTFTTSGGLGEVETGGPVMNIVPRQGGNVRSGLLFFNFANGSMQGTNYTDELKAAGLTAPNELQKVWDITAAAGGPLVRDRFWYYVNGRHQGNRNFVTGMFYNKNAGDPTKWTYEPDPSRRAIGDGLWKGVGVRLTWQLTPRNKLNVFWDETSNCIACIGGGSATVSPEASTAQESFPHRVQQVSWTSPVTNRILLESGFGTYLSWYGGTERPGNNRDLIQVTEQAGLIPGLTYRAQNWSRPYNANLNWRFALSYITGAHSLKVGYNGYFYDALTASFTNNPRLSYRLNNGIPNQLTMSGLHYKIKGHTTPAALYAQEQWTLGRLTLQGGIRYDHVRSSYPEQQAGPERFVPVAIVFPAQDGARYDDISPRGGASYDLFGNGKTAVKVTIGRYLEAASNSGIYSALNPMNRITIANTNRAWTDANLNFVPDCDLLNPATQDLRAAGGDACGAWSAQTFGRNVFSSTYDPELIEGFGVRAYNWDFGTSVTHEVMARTALTVGYFRRIYGNFTVTDNRAVGPSDYSPYSFAAPVDSRLPGGGGYSVTDLYDVRPERFGQVDNFITKSSRFGKQTEHWNGVDVTLNTRLQNGASFQGGVSTGRTVTDNCDVVPKIDSPSQRFCRVENAFLTQIKAIGAYTIPGIDVQVSGTFQSELGPQLAATYNAPNAIIQPSLGRPLAGGTANVAVNLVEPGTLYGDRINQLDFRAAKIVRIDRVRLQLGIDLYNALNSSATQTYNQTYGARWLTPTLVLPARFMKVGAQVDF